jgi:hypothetical protein
MKSRYIFSAIILLTAFNLVRAQYSTNISTTFQQSVGDLQKNSGDDALREKIIKLALTLNPKPVTPDDAITHEGAAEYAFKNAQTNSDFQGESLLSYSADEARLSDDDFPTLMLATD